MLIPMTSGLPWKTRRRKEEGGRGGGEEKMGGCKDGRNSQAGIYALDVRDGGRVHLHRPPHRQDLDVILANCEARVYRLGEREAGARGEEDGLKDMDGEHLD